MTDFSDLGLAPALMRALDEEGYVAPTPIQAQAIPVVLSGADLLGIAQTGTGKTAAFALPILHRLAENRRPAPRRGARVLVLSPTRELATQIANSFKAYGRHMGVSVAVVFGGVAHRPQITALRQGVDVLVATPGRLLDHIGERDADLSSTEILVLDEADQMLDLGFIKPIRRIVSGLSQRRQSLFFSATMPEEIATLAAELLHEPKRVAVTPVASTVERIRQRVIHIERTKKRALLAELLSDADMSRTLVFTRTKRGADRVALYLVGAAGIQAAAIHGNKSQSQREQALRQFRDGHVRVLVATDIAARGIDIDAVTHVVNYELPEVPEAYVHRIGRTARAGADGSAISLCDGEERHLLRAIERLTRQTIPSETRLNDSGLAADRTSAGREGVAAPRRDNGHQGKRHGDRQGREARQTRGGDSAGQSSAGSPSGQDRRAAPARGGHRKGSAGGHGAGHGGGYAGHQARDGRDRGAARSFSPQRDDARSENSLDGVAFLAAPKAGHRARNGHGQGQGQGNGAKSGHGADAGARHERKPNRGPAPHGQDARGRDSQDTRGRDWRERADARAGGEGRQGGKPRPQAPARDGDSRPHAARGDDRRQQPHPAARGPRPKWRQNRQRRPEAV